MGLLRDMGGCSGSREPSQSLLSRPFGLRSGPQFVRSNRTLARVSEMCYSVAMSEIRREALEREIERFLETAYTSPYWNEDGREGARVFAHNLVLTFDLSTRADAKAVEALRRKADAFWKEQHSAI